MLSENTKNKIISTYNKERIDRKNSDVELEVRYGTFGYNPKKAYLGNRNFESGVKWKTYNQVKKYLDKVINPIIIDSIDYINDNIRKTVIMMREEENEKIEWIRKESIWEQYDKEYPIKIAMSREYNIEPIENFKSKIMRKKNRRTYIIYDGNMKVDLTEVNMDIETKSEKTKYEIEIEYINKNKLDVNIFDRGVQMIMMIIYDTIELYTQSEKEEIIKYVNINLNGWNERGRENYRIKDIIDFDILVQARNLKIRDMIWGGLIGNEKTEYTITHKADGIRKLLVIHSSGIWLIMAPNEVMKISSKTKKELTGTILDGEMIPLDRRNSNAPKTRIWYIAFDCLMQTRLSGRENEGTNSIQKEKLEIRLNNCQVVADQFKDELLYVTTKKFKRLVNADEFFSIMRTMIAEQDTLAYKQDGFLFTPADTPYNPHTDRIKLKNRILTKYPDICKWKPIEQLTIDFSIKWINDNGIKKLNLYSYNRINKQLEKFIGTKEFPFTDQIDIENKLTKDIPTGEIIEYKWDNINKIFIPDRIRSDKPKPNNNEIAIDNWELINDPITEEMMKGETFVLLRKYHNRIKRSLFEQYEGTLLDIGSGLGGDVTKWYKYEKIIAVEPNKDHIIELERRIKLAGLQDRVKIINAGGQDTDIITQTVSNFIGKRVSVISLMLSLTFFWQSDDLLNNLSSTIISNIDNNGKIIFLTMDGDIVKQVFEPKLNTGISSLRSLKLGPALLEYNPPSLYINIEKSIVTKQTEWLVNIDNLTSRLSQYDFYLTSYTRADKERFLSLSESIFTEMYSYGIYSRKSDFTPFLSESPYIIPIQTPTSFTQKLQLPNISNITKLITKQKFSIKSKPLSPKIPLGFVSTPVTISPRRVSTKKKLIQTSTQNSTQIQNQPSTQNSTQNQIQTPNQDQKIELTQESKQEQKIDSSNIMRKKIGWTKNDKLLPMLPIVFDSKNDIGIGDDDYEIVKCSWYNKNNIVRIACIGDGSCFFHAILKCYYDEYANNPSYSFRTNFVKKLRRDLAYTLELPDPNTEGKLTYYESINKGAWQDLYLMELENNSIDNFGTNIDYSLEGMQKLFNSSRDVGMEVVQYVADILGLQIFILIVGQNDLYYLLHTESQKEKPIVIIAGNGYHYEVIGIDNGQYFQTVFNNDDPLIMTLFSII